MKKTKALAYLTSFALCLSSLWPISTSAAQAEENNFRTFKRVVTGQNGNLLRYHYIDDQGNPVIPAKAENQTVSRKKASDLPSSYDSRESGVITSVKDQGVTGSCWAFGALKSLEASSILQGFSTVEETDYSESHLAWYSYTPVKDSSHHLYGDYMDSNTTSAGEIYNTGGSAILSMFTLANWWGAANEENAPFTASTWTELDDMGAFMEDAPEELRFQSEVQLKEANCYDSANSGATRNKIKEAVMEYGALDAALYYDNSYLYQEDEITSYYQTLYEDSKTSDAGDYANHCVTIVGWDDDFNTFSETPKKPGAWLIANSYGEDFGTDGYFWLSYYDDSICEFYSFESQTTDTYDTIFQYDGMGWFQGYPSTEDISMANIFTNETSTPQSISAVSFYTYGDQQEYEIQVYRNINGDEPSDGEPISTCTTIGTAQWSGYHTIPLDESIAVAPGEKFSIIVTLIADSAPGNVVYALIEGSSDPDYGVYYSSQKGQSFIRYASENIWYDNTSILDEATNEVYNMNNVCVKVFSKEMSAEKFKEQEENYIPESTPTYTPIYTPTSTPTQTPVTSNKPGSTPTVNIPGSSYPPIVTFTPAPTPTISPSATSPAGALPSGKITIKNKKVTMGKGEKVSLKIKTLPVSDKSNLSYTSSNTNVVKISSTGKLLGVQPGKATIMVSSSNGAKATAKITVKKAPKTIKATINKKKLKKGKTAKIKVKLNKGSASYQITYKALNPKVAKVTKKGKIKAKKKGIAKFRVTTYNKKSSLVKIRVRA